MSAKPEHYDVIRKPIITEKTTMASENGAVVFEVAIDSNKPTIKEAVESLFDVKVKVQYYYHQRQSKALSRYVGQT